MKRRTNPAYIPPAITISFGTPDTSPFAPLHRRLGIETHVHRQAILSDPRFRQWDSVTRVWSFNHLFRDSVTLAGAA